MVRTTPARDNYVYIVSQANDSAYGFSPDIVMARVPKERVADRNAYEFFAGLDGSGRPRWSADIGQRGPIFHDPHGTQRIAITYNAPLKRYILTTSHLPPGVEATHTAALGVFDAPEPWGPWTTVFYEDHWSVVNGKDCRTYHHKFPPKWMSPDGKEMWLLYSGLDGGLYAFCLKKARLEVRGHEGGDTGAGLAAKYVGDKGIGSDPAVVFAEDFEEGSLEAACKRWESIENKGIMSLSPEVPPGSGGAQSLLMSHVGGQSNGGHLYRRLLPAYDKLYMRFYVKFDPDLPRSIISCTWAATIRRRPGRRVGRDAARRQRAFHHWSGALRQRLAVGLLLLLDGYAVLARQEVLGPRLHQRSGPQGRAWPVDLRRADDEDE